MDTLARGKENQTTSRLSGPAQLFALLALCVACNAEPPLPIHEHRIVDLTWTIDETTVVWPTSPGFTLETQHDGVTEAGYYYLSHLLHAPEHGGTPSANLRRTSMPAAQAQP